MLKFFCHSFSIKVLCVNLFLWHKKKPEQTKQHTQTNKGKNAVKNVYQELEQKWKVICGDRLSENAGRGLLLSSPFLSSKKKTKCIIAGTLENSLDKTESDFHLFFSKLLQKTRIGNMLIKYVVGEFMDFWHPFSVSTSARNSTSTMNLQSPRNTVHSTCKI